MTLIKTSFWTGLATLIKLGVGFIVNKILAIYIGPIGFAMMGQFQNFVSLVSLFSGNMMQAGIVKYISEFKNNQTEKAKILSTAFLMCLVITFLMCLVLLGLSHVFSVLLFKNVHYAWLVDAFGISLFLYVLNSFLISVLNGEGQIKLMTTSNMGSSISGLVLTYFLARHFGLSGALLAQILGQSIFFGVILFLVRNEPWFRWSCFSVGVSPGHAIKLLKFAAMTITSVLMFSVVQIIIRQYIGATLSWQDAGYWQAVNRISDSYLALISSTLSVYYLPKLSGLSSTLEMKVELKKAGFSVLPVVVLMALLVYLFRKKIILMLFSSAFMPMEPLFFFQLLGDIFKIGSWLIVYNMLSKAMIRLFIFSEIGFGISYCALSMIFLNLYGLQGVTFAFFISYLLYFIFMSYMLLKYYQLQK